MADATLGEPLSKFGFLLRGFESFGIGAVQLGVGPGAIIHLGETSAKIHTTSELKEPRTTWMSSIEPTFDGPYL